MKCDLEQIWSAQTSQKTGSVIREAIEMKNGFVAYAGVITVSEAKIFQLELDNSIEIHSNYLRRFHGVEIRVIDGLQGKKDVTIILSDNELLDIFILFIEDLVNELELLNEESEVPLVLNTRVNYWGKLFGKIKSNLLSPERQRGLYGELHILKTLLSRSSDHAKVVAAWTGPEGTQQDFTNVANGIEVKSSKATNPFINVNSEHQLDWKIFDSLYLSVVHLDEVNKGVDTLFRMISSITDIIKNQPKLIDLFNDKLSRVGVEYGTYEEYNTLGFVIRKVYFFKVEQGFPAITRETVDNNAIHNIKYQIDISAMVDYAVNEEEVLKTFL